MNMAVMIQRPLLALLILSVVAGHPADTKSATSESGLGSKQERFPSEPFIDLTTPLLQELCLAFSVPMENCTCQTMVDSVTGKSFCETINETIEANKNVTTKTVLTRTDKAFDYLQATLTLAASILAIVGNGLVIAVYVGNGKDQGKCKYLITALAFTDLCFAILQIVVTIPRFWTPTWIYGAGICRLFSALYSLGSLVAMGIIVIIAVERYIGIVHPLNLGLSWSMAYMLLIGNAMLCIIVVIPQGAVSEITEQKTCQEKWPGGNRSSLIYSWLILLVFYALPCVVVSCLYTIIIRTLLESARLAATLSSQDSYVGKKRQADNHRIMLILVSILVAFIILVLPNRLVWVVFDMIGDLNKLSHSSYKAWVYTGILPYPFHTAVNPIIYSLVDLKFRRDVARLFGCHGPTTATPSEILPRSQMKSTNETEVNSNSHEVNELRPISSNPHLIHQNGTSADKPTTISQKLDPSVSEEANFARKVKKLSIASPKAEGYTTLNSNVGQEGQPTGSTKKMSTVSQRKAAGYITLDESRDESDQVGTEKK